MSVSWCRCGFVGRGVVEHDPVAAVAPTGFRVAVARLRFAAGRIDAGADARVAKTEASVLGLFVGDVVVGVRDAFLLVQAGKRVANAYYYIGDKHTERAGLGLCRSRAGTGINASGRKPQPRYGDTNSGWGDCADWIVFNDAAPNEPAPKP